jgi:TolB-like protein/Tfp pilus assembly protein PilF
MASILPGYEYDIFISYRHNDNQDGWVTDFVQNLEKELRGTLKDTVTIYFDQNPHDGLLETHNVDKSLEGKLKCLIFIPIISQTYCDPKSFAWQHEFVAFNTLVKQDQFGRDIKLNNGNVASRILPVKIHDLDLEDKSIVESEIGGVLRAIEFIYKEAGVNRPLRSQEDNPQTNLNKTFYRDQVNKVANAIKEIVAALKNPQTAQPSNIGPRTANNIERNSNRKKFVIISMALLFIIVIGYFYYQQRLTNNRQPLTEIEKSIAVLPFVNMSNDPEQEYFSDGISEEILNLLAKVPELKVIGRTSSFFFKGKNEDLRVIGEKLGVANLLEGSVRKDGDKIRITAQLIRASDGTHLWSETYDRKLESVFELQDEIANNVLKELKLKLLGAAIASEGNNVELQNLILKGKYFANQGEFKKGIEVYQQALTLDSGNASLWAELAKLKIGLANTIYTKDFNQDYRLIKDYAKRAIALDKNNSNAHRMLGLVYMLYDFDWKEAEKELTVAIELDPNNSDAYRSLGDFNSFYLSNETLAIENYKKSVELNPLSFASLSNLGAAYFNSGKYHQAISIFQQSLEINTRANRSLFYIYIVTHQPQLAKALLQEMPALPNEREKMMMQALVEYEIGQTEKAYQTLTNCLVDYSGDSYRPARVFAYMNKKDEALQWLDKAYKEKFGMYQLQSDRLMVNLRSDPRYGDLLKKMNILANN